MDWLLENWTAVVAAALTVATIITRLTPTPRDDAALATVRGLLGRLSVLEHRDTGRVAKLPGAKPAPGERHPDD
ncbi:MAG: hypothetical protein GY772_02585 [bacterium]|nr:hypothetical protein [bacterium]MCP4436645.1 hypothetical protein [Actinomycetes bacterium]MCP4919353.1 hypothetical protein [Pseudomonadota bacterium]